MQSFTLDAYAARSCPVKTHNAFHPGLSVPTRADEGLREVFHGGVAFEAEVLDELLRGFTGTVLDARLLTDLPSAEQEQITLAAMAGGVQVLIAPLLPRDVDQHRSGRPDLLLRADDGGYHPAEIKFHRVSDPRREPATLTWSSLADPLTRHELPGRRFRHTWRLNDLLQLAHYHRMLQRIAADENLHMIFYRDVSAAGLDFAPNQAMKSLHRVLRNFKMPGYTVPEFRRKAVVIAVGGVYDPRIHLDDVVMPVLKKWRIFEREDFTGEAAEMRDDLGKLVEVGAYMFLQDLLHRGWLHGDLLARRIAA